MPATTPIHLVKLCVGVDSVAELVRFREQRAAKDPDYLPCHVTRMWPKRADEVLAGGSLYWVIKGAIRARQRILRLDEVIGEDGIRRCGIVMEREVIRTAHAARRPFQGWRYLPAADAPPDLTRAQAGDDTLPGDLSAALAEIGVL